MVTVSPSSPIYLYQLMAQPASIATLALTEPGNTLSLYSALCLSNISVQGMDTTRTFLPLASSSSAAFMASSTSEPLAMSITSGFSLPRSM